VLDYDFDFLFLIMRLTILLLIIITTALNTRAQILLGAKGGLNVSTLGTAAQYKPRLGYNAGFFYSQHLESQYGWQLELQYSLQGARDAATTNGRLTYHYLAMPILLKLYFKESTYAEVGPQVAYLMGAKYKEQGFEDDRSASVRKWDFLGLVGFGHETDSGTQFGLRFGFGFLNTSGASVGNTVVFRNLILQAHVGFKLKDLE
jgi:hypothetical protein